MQQVTQRRLRTAGFTLVELMIAIVVISLLAAIAVPQYNGFLQDSRRSEAFSALNQVSVQLEQWHSERNTYTVDLTDLGYTAATWNTTDNGNYQLRVIGASAGCPINMCYRLRVRPVNGSEQWGDDYTYELYSDGRRASRVCPENVCSGPWLNGWVDD